MAYRPAPPPRVMNVYCHVLSLLFWLRRFIVIACMDSSTTFALFGREAMSSIRCRCCRCRCRRHVRGRCHFRFVVAVVVLW